jgi:hypothetical protein
MFTRGLPVYHTPSLLERNVAVYHAPSVLKENVATSLKVLASTCSIPAEAFSGTLSLLPPSQVSPEQPAFAATHGCPGNTSQLLGFIPNGKISGDFQGLDTHLIEYSHRFTGVPLLPLLKVSREQLALAKALSDPSSEMPVLSLRKRNLVSIFKVLVSACLITIEAFIVAEPSTEHVPDVLSYKDKAPRY